MTCSDAPYDSFRRSVRLIQINPLPYKGLSEHVEETIRIAQRDYLHDPKVSLHQSRLYKKGAASLDAAPSKNTKTMYTKY